MSEWFQDESFWEETYDFLFPDKLIKESPGQAESILKLAGCDSGAVLDLCCGPGRYATVLAAKGFRVTGVDRSAFLLEKAGHRAETLGVTVEWVLEDMRRFVRPGAYDLVLNMFTSFGYFEDKQDDIRVLENVFTNLKPGGIFVIDLMSKERLARMYQPVFADTLDDGAMLVQRPEIRNDWTRVRNQWTVVKNGRAKTFAFEHTLYSGQELKERMERVGFTSIKLYGDLDKSPYDVNARRLVLKGAKPAAR